MDAGLVVNLGLKSVRAIVFDRRGRKVATASRPVQTVLRDSWIEQDADEWWEKAAQCVRDVLFETDTSAPAFVTVTASAACLVPVAESGRPLRRAIMVSDRRSVEEAERLTGLPQFEAVQATNSSFSADPYFMVPKALWIREKEPEVFERTRWMMSPGDYLILRLCGEAATDPLNAEKAFYDTDEEAYPVDLLRELCLAPDLWPPVRRIGATVGEVNRAGSDATGIAEGTPVVMATYDAICAFWGSGVKEPGDVADVSGTVTSVRVLSDRAVSGVEERVFTQEMPGTDHYIVGGSNNLGGGLIEWLKQSFYRDEPNAYELMEREARESSLAARGILFLPYLLGERCPIWNPNARGVFFGLERQHQRRDFARAVFESAAFALQHVLITIRSGGIDPGSLRVSGGLARIGLIASIKADVTGLPVEIVKEFETTSLGAFLLAGTGVGMFDSIADAADLVRVREVVIPDPEANERYAEWFSLYRRLYDSLTDLFEERQDLFTRHGLGGAERLENL